jgi:2'-5' RNA ligase
VSVPEEVRSALAGAQSELRRDLEASGPARIRWVRPEQFHLTLKFLGTVEQERSDVLATALGEVCGRFDPLRLRAGGIGVFPESGLPRVIWAGVGDAGERLLPVQRAVETAVKEFAERDRPGQDDAPENKKEKFTGHLTLGRVREARRPDAALIARAARAMAGRPFGEWTADGIEIMRSELSPEGARHLRVASIPFGGLA